MLEELDRLESGLAAAFDAWRWWIVGAVSLLYLSVTCVLAQYKLFWNDELFTLYISRLPTVSDIWAILATGQNWIDSALSFGIGALILWSGFGIVRETLNILLEGTPRGIKLERVEAAIREIDGVNDVHDLHVWNLGSETRALSCHISIADIPPSVSERILRDVRGCLHTEFHIDHTTIQFEHSVCEVAHGCVIPVTEQH